MVNVLEPRIKHSLLAWFIKLQLNEYAVLFADNQDVSIGGIFTFVKWSLNISGLFS